MATSAPTCSPPSLVFKKEPVVTYGKAIFILSLFKLTSKMVTLSLASNKSVKWKYFQTIPSETCVESQAVLCNFSAREGSSVTAVSSSSIGGLNGKGGVP